MGPSLTFQGRTRFAPRTVARYAVAEVGVSSEKTFGRVGINFEVDRDFSAVLGRP